MGDNRSGKRPSVSNDEKKPYREEVRSMKFSLMQDARAVYAPHQLAHMHSKSVKTNRTKDMADSSTVPTKDTAKDNGENFFSASFTVDGDVFPRLPVKISTEEHVRKVRKMPMREDDIIIAAFPKCGTHWIWEVAQMLIAGKAEHDSRTKEQVMIEFTDVELFDPIPSPRVLNSHLFPRQLSTEVVTKKSRVIHVIRNPKDVTVSMYFHFRQMKGSTDPGFLNFAQAFLQGGQFPGSFGDYFAYMQEMMKWQKEHPEVPVINIYFEDVKKDPVQCVQQLAQFLQVEASDQLCADIADECSFQKLKQANETKDKSFVEKNMFKGGAAKLYRKGEVGDWKNYFTVALSEQYDQLVPEKLKDYDLKLQYTI